MNEGMEVVPSPPDHLSEAAKSRWQQLIAAAGSGMNSFNSDAATVIAEHPEMVELVLKKHRDRAVQDVGRALADSGLILDLPPEVLLQLLKLTQENCKSLFQAVHAVRMSSVQLTLGDMTEVVNTGRVAHVMEEAQPGDSDEMLEEKAQGPYIAKKRS